MKGLFTIRLKDRDKEAISLSSKITGIPTSKMLYPFIDEGLRINLGASLLYLIDRSAPFNRGKFERFMDHIRSSKGQQMDPVDGREDIQPSDISPRVIIDYIWIMREIRLHQRLEQAMEGIQLSPELDCIELNVLRRLSRDLGERYITSGSPLNRLDAPGATRMFFSLMTEAYYRHNARGTLKTLNTRWYGNQDLISKLVEEMASRYEHKYPARVVEAIEVNDQISRELPRKTKKKKPIRQFNVNSARVK